jgi:hypothetical protein
MITDAPTKGKWTFYGFTGEVFLWMVFAGFAVLNLWSFKQISMQRNKRASR